MRAPAWLRPPSALQVATRQLEDAQREHLASAAAAELYAAHAAMLLGRVDRLRGEILRLSAERGPGPA